MSSATDDFASQHMPATGTAVARHGVDMSRLPAPVTILHIVILSFSPVRGGRGVMDAVAFTDAGGLLLRSVKHPQRCDQR